jgi:hypothetical protein
MSWVDWWTGNPPHRPLERAGGSRRAAGAAAGSTAFSPGRLWMPQSRTRTQRECTIVLQVVFAHVQGQIESQPGNRTRAPLLVAAQQAQCIQTCGREAPCVAGPRRAAAAGACVLLPASAPGGRRACSRRSSSSERPGVSSWPPAAGAGPRCAGGRGARTRSGPCARSPLRTTRCCMLRRRPQRQLLRPLPTAYRSRLGPLNAQRRSPVIAPDIAIGSGEDQVLKGVGFMQAPKERPHTMQLPANLSRGRAGRQLHAGLGS